jgi:hypothetical protein
MLSRSSNFDFLLLAKAKATKAIVANTQTAAYSSRVIFIMRAPTLLQSESATQFPFRLQALDWTVAPGSSEQETRFTCRSGVERQKIGEGSRLLTSLSFPRMMDHLVAPRWSGNDCGITSRSTPRCPPYDGTARRSERIPTRSQTPASKPSQSSQRRSSTVARCDRRSGFHRRSRNFLDFATSPHLQIRRRSPADHLILVLKHNSPYDGVTGITLRKPRPARRRSLPSSAPTVPLLDHLPPPLRIFGAI